MKGENTVQPLVHELSYGRCVTPVPPGLTFSKETRPDWAWRGPYTPPLCVTRTICVYPHQPDGHVAENPVKVTLSPLPVILWILTSPVLPRSASMY